MGEKNYDAANERLLAREERILDRKKEKLEAFERNMKKTIANTFAKNRQLIAKEALEATKHPDRVDERMRAAGDGAFINSGEIITGREKRVWEQEADE
jgi:hypothetical protein